MNETKIFPSILVIVIPALVFVVIGFFIAKNYYPTQEEGLGSVSVTNEYQATTTAEMSGALAKATEFNQLIASSTHGTAVLGSVVVASTTAAAMNIYNATSTDAIADGTYSTLITRFPTSTPQGTYVFDVELLRGLAIQLQAGFTGDYVITWRK